jgi:hypothetical protein
MSSDMMVDNFALLHLGEVKAVELPQKDFSLIFEATF